MNGDGTYDITYDDGDSEVGVPAAQIRVPGDSSGGGVAVTTTGAAVEEQDSLKALGEYMSRMGISAAKQAKMRAALTKCGGDAVKEAKLFAQIEKKNGGTVLQPQATATAAGGSADSGGSGEVESALAAAMAVAGGAFAVGDAVEGNFGGEGQWFGGKVIYRLRCAALCACKAVVVRSEAVL